MSHGAGVQRTHASVAPAPADARNDASINDFHMLLAEMRQELDKEEAAAKARQKPEPSRTDVALSLLNVLSLEPEPPPGHVQSRASRPPPPLDPDAYGPALPIIPAPPPAPGAGAYVLHPSGALVPAQPVSPRGGNRPRHLSRRISESIQASETASLQEHLRKIKQQAAANNIARVGSLDPPSEPGSNDLRNRSSVPSVASGPGSPPVGGHYQAGPQQGISYSNLDAIPEGVLDGAGHNMMAARMYASSVANLPRQQQGGDSSTNNGKPHNEALVWDVEKLVERTSRHTGKISRVDLATLGSVPRLQGLSLPPVIAPRSPALSGGGAPPEPGPGSGRATFTPEAKLLGPRLSGPLSDSLSEAAAPEAAAAAHRRVSLAGSAADGPALARSLLAERRGSVTGRRESFTGDRPSASSALGRQQSRLVASQLQQGASQSDTHLPALKEALPAVKEAASSSANNNKSPTRKPGPARTDRWQF